ncbi:MAG TPA: indole-3-glycerol phosphate synthase TrpC [Solirubrobacteraceae bacterium]|nr:indole-3-glycerol phosphate synthase TrpC [Solirubrobacteraceae bacterium]
MNVLEGIIATTRLDVAERRRRTPVAELQRQVAERAATGDRRSFAGALRAPGLSVIAEHKRSSPSAGVIRTGSELAAVVSAYERAGAAALSILTEERNFGGTLDDLRAARAVALLPLLRKDFVVDPYQVYEAGAAGADAILLIVAALEPTALSELHALAGELELAALVEVHDAHELELAVNLGAELIGVNNRDLTTLRVDTERTFALRELIPAGPIVVAESGFSTPEQLARLAGAGIDAVLVGEALMRSPDVEAACRALTGVAV